MNYVKHMFTENMKTSTKNGNNPVINKTAGQLILKQNTHQMLLLYGPIHRSVKIMPQTESMFTEVITKIELLE